ncbi:cation:proton antiporter [Streptomyces sioyaensis]|uniref:cation:proton antiporter domain-containing protein n=1 Tax=Streptomyces sioyaensis TaxID=67364 RepID=UPI0033C8B80B
MTSESGGPKADEAERWRTPVDGTLPGDPPPRAAARTVKALAEVTLVWVLFTDAARLSFRALRPELGLYVRLLGIGLPLCVGLGTLLASALLPGVSGWAALYVGAALAPTDAVLGATMMVNPEVPVKIRRSSTRRAASTTASSPRWWCSRWPGWHRPGGPPGRTPPVMPWWSSPPEKKTAPAPSGTPSSAARGPGADR